MRLTLGLLFVLLACSFCSSSPTLASAQSLRYGYTLSASSDAGVPLAFPPGGGLQMTRRDDSCTPNVPIGFPFTFYGRTYTSVTVSSNGNVQFDTSSTLTSSHIPPFDLDNLFWPIIAVFWVDLLPDGAAGVGNITAATVGTAPNRVFVVRYYKVPYFHDEWKDVTADVELYESSNTIKMRYFSVLPTFHTVTVGVSNAPNPDWSWSDLTVLNAVPINDTVTTQLTNTTLTYTPFSTPYQSRAVWPVRTRVGAYSASVTRSATSLSWPSTIENLTVVTPPYSGSMYTLPLNFTFTFFDTDYSQVSLMPTGLIQFAPTGGRPPSPTFELPMNTTTELQPFLAYALASWSNGAFAYATQTSASTGMRSFHLWHIATPTPNAYVSPSSGGPTALAMQGAASDSEPAAQRVTFGPTPFAIELSLFTYNAEQIACEVVLFESDMSIEVRYVNVPNYYSSLLVGLQSAPRPGTANATVQPREAYDYVAVVNNLLLADTVVNLLNNSVVRFANCAGNSGDVACTSSSTGGDSGQATTSDAQRGVVASGAVQWAVAFVVAVVLAVVY